MADSAAHGRQIAALNTFTPCGANTVGKDDSESLDHDLNITNHAYTRGGIRKVLNRRGMGYCFRRPYQSANFGTMVPSSTNANIDRNSEFQCFCDCRIELMKGSNSY